MTRVFKKIGNFALFHDLPGVHQRHPIGILTHQRQIVCNQQQGYTVLFLQFLEQIQNLRLTRYVKRRRGFVSHHDIGTTSQRHGDHDTLLLAPRKFVRKRIKTLLRLVQADAGEPLQRPLPGLFLADTLMQSNRFNNLLTHRHHGIKTRGRLLKNHRDAIASYGLHLVLGEFQQIRSVEAHLAAIDI